MNPLNPKCPKCDLPTPVETAVTEFKNGTVHWWHRPCWWGRFK